MNASPKQNKSAFPFERLKASSIEFVVFKVVTDLANSSHIVDLPQT